MIAIVVVGGVVQAVYSDNQGEKVNVLDFDNAENPASEVSVEQLNVEVERMDREMHAVY